MKWLLPVPLGRRRKDFGAGDPFQCPQRLLGRLGIALAVRSQASNVLPAGSSEARRRIEIVAWSRPAASSAAARAGLRCAPSAAQAAVAITSGAARRR